MIGLLNDPALTPGVLASIPGRVARGAALLDEERPGWESEIDLGRLDIRDCGACVLGQLFGNYLEGVTALEIDGGCRDVSDRNASGIPYGFCAGSYDPEGVHAESLDLAREWAGLVERRLDQELEGATT